MLSIDGQFPIEELFLEIEPEFGVKMIGYFDENGEHRQVLIGDDSLFWKCIAFLEQIDAPKYTMKEVIDMEKRVQ